MNTIILTRVSVPKESEEKGYPVFWEFPENVLYLCGWDFSLKEIAEFEIPDKIKIVSDETGHKYFSFNNEYDWKAKEGGSAFQKYENEVFFSGCQYESQNLLLKRRGDLEIAPVILLRRQTLYIENKLNRMKDSAISIFKNAPEFNASTLNLHEQREKNYPFI